MLGMLEAYHFNSIRDENVRKLYLSMRSRMINHMRFLSYRRFSGRTKSGPGKPGFMTYDTEDRETLYKMTSNLSKIHINFSDLYVDPSFLSSWYDPYFRQGRTRIYPASVFLDEEVSEELPEENAMKIKQLLIRASRKGLRMKLRSRLYQAAKHRDPHPDLSAVDRDIYHLIQAFRSVRQVLYIPYRGWDEVSISRAASLIYLLYLSELAAFSQASKKEYLGAAEVSSSYSRVLKMISYLKELLGKKAYILVYSLEVSAEKEELKIFPNDSLAIGTLSRQIDASGGSYAYNKIPLIAIYDGGKEVLGDLEKMQALEQSLISRIG